MNEATAKSFRGRVVVLLLLLLGVMVLPASAQNRNVEGTVTD